MFVKLMADYCSSGVWCESGSMMELEELPITDGLALDITKWCHWYEKSEFFLAPEDRSRPFNVDAFNKQGVLLMRRLESELPGWTVTYRPED